MEEVITVTALYLATFKLMFMKTKILAFLFLMNLCTYVHSQIVIDLFSNNIPIPENYNETGQYYEKDINNLLNPFVGTWEYVNGNEKFQLTLTKITKYHEVTSSSPYLNLNYYTDGIAYKYKKYVNGNLVFESTTVSRPTFTILEGNVLKGKILDYGRITKTVYKPQIVGGGILKQGGEYFDPICRIELQPLSLSESPKIKFSLGFRENFGEYTNPIYDGQPKFSIPNNVILTKVP